MKICMLNPFYSPYSGGTEKHVYEVSVRLAKKHDVTVLTARLPGTKLREEMQGVHVVRVPGLVLNKLPYPFPPPVPFSPLFLSGLVSELPRHDVFHFHNRFFYNLIDVTLAKRVGKKKTALTLHNARITGISPVADAIGAAYDDTLGRAMMSNMDALAAVSRNTLDLTLPPQLHGRASVVYNGVDSKQFSPKAASNRLARKYGFEGKKVVLSVARFEEQKGFAYLLRAFAGVREEHRDAVLVLLGRGSQEASLREEAARLKISHNTLFITERVSEKELAGIYASCDVFVLASVWEPFGMAVVEAMASGRPVVGTNVGGIPEVVTRETGFLFAPRDAYDLQEKISRLLGDSSLRRRMGGAGRKRAEKVFTWDNTAKGYEKMYASLEK